VTPSTGTDEHPEVAEISALAEGILPPDRSADVRGHLDDCVLCADVRASLDEIRNLLGTLPGPPRMPADIAGRIDAALAAEALLDSTPRDSARLAVSRETTAELVPAHVSRETTAPLDRPVGRAPAATGPGRARPRRHWRKGLLIATPVAAVLVLGGVLTSSLSPSGNSSNSNSTTKRTADAGVKAKNDDLEASVYSLLAGTTMSPMLSPDRGPVGHQQHRHPPRHPARHLSGQGLLPGSHLPPRRRLPGRRVRGGRLLYQLSGKGSAPRHLPAPAIGRPGMLAP